MKCQPTKCLFLVIALTGLGSSPLLAADRTIGINTLRDKISGGWVGHMAGVCWGAPTEFSHQGSIIPDGSVPAWTPDMINGGFGQDDLYVEMPFVNAMNNNGVNCDWTTFGDYFKIFTPQLWHANMMGRQNLQNGYPVPDSGHYGVNQHCDDIDWQIESNPCGIMAPGQPNAAAELAWRAGHTMNYGDGVYGGVFIAAMHAEAYFATNINQMIEAGRLAIPAGSKYRQVIEDVIAWKAQGNIWQQNWQLLQTKWGGTDRCPDGAGNNFNIDAKLNGAYVLMGLLYGNGDFETSVRIAMQCGQDSDCNPGSAAAVLGTYYGLSGIPGKFTSGLSQTGTFSGTSYTVDQVRAISEGMARQILALTGGTTSGSGSNETWTIPWSAATPLILEQWPTNANTAPSLNASLVTQSNLTITLSATAADSDGIYGYQWFFGDMTFTKGADVLHTYRLPGTYSVICYVADNIGNTSYRVLTLDVPNTNPPVLVGMVATASNHVRVSYNKPVEPVSATNLSHYAITPGVTILGATFDSDSKTIVLTTSSLATGVTYTGTVDGVNDLAVPPNTIAPNSQATFILVSFACWHSYAALLAAGSPQGRVFDEQGTVAAGLEFYESTDNSGVNRAGLFGVFNPGSHPQSFNAVGTYWANASGNAYPYAGKSLVARNAAEGHVPMPLGVMDLQLHPPNNDHLVVAALVAPFDGTYRLTDLGARRVYTSGTTATYRIFDPRRHLIANLQASNNTAWITDTNVYWLGRIAAGDRIYFTVDRDGDYGWDATEVAWTLSASLAYGAINLQAQLVGGGQLQLIWPVGTLLEAADLNGPWITNGAASPYTFKPTSAQQYFRLLVQ
jgi:hypothetical protein